MFLGLPRWIYINISGTFLVAYAFGPIAGMSYAGLLNLALNSIGMGSGVIIHVLLIQMFEAGLIGLLQMKRMQGAINILLIGLVLSIAVKPISIIFYSLFHAETSGFISNLVKIYVEYMKTGFISNLIKYLISGIIAYTIYEGINRFILKRRKDTIL